MSYRSRGHDCSGYDTDTGVFAARGYGPRYCRTPVPPPQAMYPHPHQQRAMFRPDGYDTDSGLISSGRLRMTRALPPRMAAIPETVAFNNRMGPPTNLNTIPQHLRTSSFLNQPHLRSEKFSGYETDSGMNTRQHNYGYRHVPVDMQFSDNGWTGQDSLPRWAPQQPRFIDNNQRYRSNNEHLRSTSIPVFSQHPDSQVQQKQVS